MRLIDADVLKQDLSRFYHGIITARELVDSQPTVEQPKVIRCKDCKFAYRKETNLSNSYECRYPFLLVKENHYGDFFCAFAEPKDGEQE